jgi:hypothetical protein
MTESPTAVTCPAPRTPVAGGGNGNVVVGTRVVLGAVVVGAVVVGAVVVGAVVVGAVVVGAVVVGAVVVVVAAAAVAVVPEEEVVPGIVAVDVLGLGAAELPTRRAFWATGPLEPQAARRTSAKVAPATANARP